MEDRNKLLTADITDTHRYTALLIDIADSLEKIAKELQELNKSQNSSNSKMGDINDELKRMRVNTSFMNKF